MQSVLTANSSRIALYLVMGDDYMDAGGRVTQEQLPRDRERGGWRKAPTVFHPLPQPSPIKGEGVTHKNRGLLGFA